MSAAAPTLLKKEPPVTLGSVIAYLRSPPCLQTGAIAPHLNVNQPFAPRHAASPIWSRPRICCRLNRCRNSSHLFANRHEICETSGLQTGRHHWRPFANRSLVDAIMFANRSRLFARSPSVRQADSAVKNRPKTWPRYRRLLIT